MLEPKVNESTAPKDVTWGQITGRLFAQKENAPPISPSISWDQVAGGLMDFLQANNVDTTKAPTQTNEEVNLKKNVSLKRLFEGSVPEGTMQGVPIFTNPAMKPGGLTDQGVVVLSTPDMVIPREEGGTAVSLFMNKIGIRTPEGTLVPTDMASVAAHEQNHAWLQDLANPEMYKKLVIDTGQNEIVKNLNQQLSAGTLDPQTYRMYFNSLIEEAAHWAQGLYGEPDPNSKYISVWQQAKQYQPQDNTDFMSWYKGLMGSSSSTASSDTPTN